MTSSVWVIGWLSSRGNVTRVVRPPAGLRGLDVGVVVEQVLRGVFPLDRGDVGAPSASVARSRAASVEGGSLTSGVTGPAGGPVAPLRSLASLPSPTSPRTTRVP